MSRDLWRGGRGRGEFLLPQPPKLKEGGRKAGRVFQERTQHMLKDLERVVAKAGSRADRAVNARLSELLKQT